MRRCSGDRLRVTRLFLKANHSALLVDLHHAELPRRLFRHPQGADGQIGIRVLVVLDHRTVIHLVDVVAGQNHNAFGAFLFNRVDVLIHGVGGTLIPVGVNPLLRWHHIDEFPQVAAEEPPPAQVDVTVQTHGLELRQQQHAPQATVQAIGQREIDDAVSPAERHGRLGAVSGQRLQSLAAPACQNHRQRVLHDPISIPKPALPLQRRRTRVKHRTSVAATVRASTTSTADSSD